MFRFESDLHRYEDLLERHYIDALFYHLAHEMGSDFTEFEFLVWSHMGPGDVPESVSAHSGERRVVIHLSDESCSVPDCFANAPSAIFKCYLPREYPERRVFAMPLGYAATAPASRAIPVEHRTYNVFFSGCSQNDRLAMATALYRLANRNFSPPAPEALKEFCLSESANLSQAFPDSYIRFTSQFASGLSSAEYSTVLANSKIALCPPGWKSAETFRHFEAMRAGCVIVSGPLPDTRIYRGAPFVILEDWASLGDAVTELLSNPGQLQKLQKQTLSWWQSVCSEQAMARFIASQLVRVDLQPA